MQFYSYYATAMYAIKFEAIPVIDSLASHTVSVLVPYFHVIFLSITSTEILKRVFLGI